MKVFNGLSRCLPCAAANQTPFRPQVTWLASVVGVLGMLAANDSCETILEGYPWQERAAIQACLVYARRHVANERIEPLTITAGAAV